MSKCPMGPSSALVTQAVSFSGALYVNCVGLSVVAG